MKNMKELKNILAQSSDSYYDFLCSNNKSRSIINITDIKQVKSKSAEILYELHITGKLVDVDYINSTKLLTQWYSSTKSVLKF
ncbi:MAG: hypothetical protein R3Y09_07805 [Clostridia bacterium]